MAVGLAETGDPVLSLRGIGKTYGTVSVLRDVDLDLHAGECVALAGENGAGKSTLSKIITGVTTSASGTLRIDGQVRAFRTPRDARTLGIALIPQELAYVPTLTVGENIMLTNWPDGRLFTSKSWMMRSSRQLLGDLGIGIDVRRPMISLSLAERQIVEIAKALAGSARVLVLDEPTAALPRREVDTLHARLEALKGVGVAMIYISHNLRDCFDISDRIAVLRNGSLVAASKTMQTTPQAVVDAMLGAGYTEPIISGVVADPERESMLIVEGWNAQHQPPIEDVSFQLGRGEVLGIYGLVGSGAESVAKGLAGHGRRVQGALTIRGRVHAPPRTPKQAHRLGIAYVPAERKADGIAAGHSIAEHLTLLNPSSSSWHGISRRREARRIARELIQIFDIRCQGPDQPIGLLSGGNQQRVLIASRLFARPKVLVLHEPTRGVDIGSRAKIHQYLVDYVREPSNESGVVLVSSDLEEAVNATDRLLVMRAGRIVAELSGVDKTEGNALKFASSGGIAR